jgi:uncharacterized protein
MKFILFVVALLALLWLIKGSVARRMPPPRDPGAATKPQPMVTCAQCGLHLPRTDALPGRGGVFCGEAHRAEYERNHPAA